MKHDLGHKNIYHEYLNKPDTLLERLHIKLDEDQQFYLNTHMHEKRTILAKKLGIEKFQLNQLLHSMKPDFEEARRKISKRMRGNKNAKKAG